jgi:hypothetical protein
VLGRFFTIAGNTFLETIRQPIYGVILLVTALMFILNIGLAAFTLEDDDKLLLDLGLCTLLISGLFLSAFSAAGVLTREIDNKTVLTVVSKPVARPVLIGGKYAGLAGAMAVALYLGLLMLLLTQRHGVLQTSRDPWDMPVLVFGFGAAVAALTIAAFCNYFYGTEFASTAIGLAVPLLTIGVLLTCFWDRTWQRQPFGTDMNNPNLYYAAILVMLAVMVLAAVALAASTRLGQVMTLLVCVLVTMIGLVSDYALGQHASDSVVAQVLYHLVPNLGFYGVIDAASANVGVPESYVGLTTGYTVLLVIAILAIAVALFQRREVG